MSDSPLAVTRRDRPVLLGLAAGWVTAGLTTLLLASKAWGRGVESEALALGIGTLLCVLGAASALGASPGTLAPRTLRLAAVVSWLGLAVLVAFAHAPNNWDELAYLLSGLALRGSATPYAEHRPPLVAVLCAVFADAPRLVNPLLLAGLLALILGRGGRRFGIVPAAFAALVLLWQDLFLAASLDVLSELPAALLVSLAFLALDARRPLAAGAALSLAVLTRWNLAVLPLCVALDLLVRRRFRELALFVCGGAVPALLWLGVSAALHGLPFAAIYRGSYLAARSWAPADTAPPDFSQRFLAYAPFFFFLTPAGLAGLVLGALRPTGSDESGADAWALQRALPLSVLAYCVCMLFVGGLFPRFFVPLLPITLLVAAHEWRLALPRVPSSAVRGALVSTLACSASVLGLWPGHAFVFLRQNLAFRAPLGATLCAAGPRYLAKGETLYAPPLRALSDVNGYPAMYALRHRIAFPTARRDSTYAILPDTDPAAATRALVSSLPDGAAVLVPTSALAASPLRDTLTDGAWTLGRVKRP